MPVSNNNGGLLASNVLYYAGQWAISCSTIPSSIRRAMCTCSKRGNHIASNGSLFYQQRLFILRRELFAFYKLREKEWVQRRDFANFTCSLLWKGSHTKKRVGSQKRICFC